MNSRAAAMTALQDRIGYAFGDRDLLERALTHASAARPGSRAVDNEILEFLGDRVLGLLAAEALVETNPSWREGELSRRHAALVSGKSCATIARALKLGPALRLAGGTSRQGGRDNDRILGDAMEALMAAVYLDGGQEAARVLFTSAWRDVMREALGEQPKDAKTDLQEWAMAQGLALPVYTVVTRSGAPHDPVFTVSVEIAGYPAASGVGPSLRSAQTAAAQALLQRERPSA
ncbi:MAG TPA: ribonuclease III [Caulobacteraceae bacterium]